MSTFDINLRVEELGVELGMANAYKVTGCGLVSASRDAIEALGGLNELNFILEDTGSSTDFGNLSIMEEPAVLSLNCSEPQIDQVVKLAGMTSGTLGFALSLEEDQMGTYKVRTCKARRRFS